jgi:hypothetical protein
MRAADAVERALALEKPSAPAPAGFTEGVMRRVASARHVPSTATLPAPGSLVGWLLADPALATSCVLAVLAAWWREPLWALAFTIASRAIALVPESVELTLRPAPVVAALASPGVVAGMAIGLLPLVALGSRLLTNWSERAFARKLPIVSRIL